MANSADLDQLASSEANWSGSTLFTKTGHIQVQRTRVNVYISLDRDFLIDLFYFFLI